jgi:tRNA (cytidine/uridine-2'-O-)-methyltransferase
VGRLGFHLDNKEVQRAGLDYWEKVQLTRHDSWEKFLESLPQDARLLFFSTKGQKTYWDIAFAPGDYLVFGKETAGFPKNFYEVYQDRMYRIPQQGDAIRSLNLSTSVGIVLFEALRQSKSK